MIREIQNLARAEDLPGETLIAPIKSYNSYFAKKVDESHGLQKGAWEISHFISGLVVYPVTGLTAAIGLLVRWTARDQVRQHNEGVLVELNAMEAGIVNSDVFGDGTSGGAPTQRGWTNLSDFHESIHVDDVYQKIRTLRETVNRSTAEYKKIYLKTEGEINKLNPRNHGEITVDFLLHRKQH